MPQLKNHLKNRRSFSSRSNASKISPRRDFEHSRIVLAQRRAQPSVTVFWSFFLQHSDAPRKSRAPLDARAERHAQPFSNYGGEADARGDARRARCRGVRFAAPEVPLAGDARGDAHRAAVRGPDGPGGGIGGRRAEPLAARERGAGRVRPAVRRGEGEHRPGDWDARAPGVRCRRGHERARCVPFEFEPRHRDIVGFLPRALVFKIRTDARSTTSFERTQAPRILDRSPTPRLGRPIRARASPWRTSRPRSSTWCVARAFPARRGGAKTTTADARFDASEQRHFFFSRSALKTRFARASPPRVSPSRPFHPRPRRLIAIPSRLEQERLKPGRSVLRAGAQVRRSARRAEHARARPEFLRERRFRKTRAISAAVRHSCRRSKRASPPVADARSRLRTRRARSRASPNPNAPDPPNPAPARVRRSPRTPARASGRARRRARSRIDICDDKMTATTRHSRRDIASSLRPRLELTIDGSLFGSLFDTPR